MENLFIAKSIIKDTNLKEEAVAVAVALQSIINKRRNEYYITFSMLSYYLYGKNYNRKSNRQDLTYMKSGFKSLVDNGYIKILYQNDRNNEFECDLSKLKRDNDEYFVQITDEELHKIMTLEFGTDVNRYKLFKFYICILSTFKLDEYLDEIYKNKFSVCAMEYFYKLTSLSKSAMYNYCSILEEKQLLYVVRSKNYKSSSKELVNVYCRYSDAKLSKEFIKKYLKYNIDEEPKKDNNGNTINFGDLRRGLAQKYNALLRGKKYSHRELLEIFAYAYEWNKKKDCENAVNRNHGYKEIVLKDLSIFANLLKSSEIDAITAKIDYKFKMQGRNK